MTKRLYTCYLYCLLQYKANPVSFLAVTSNHKKIKLTDSFFVYPEIINIHLLRAKILREQLMHNSLDLSPQFLLVNPGLSQVYEKGFMRNEKSGIKIQVSCRKILWEILG